MNDMVDITGVDLVRFVKKVYDLSRPVGLGYLHYTPAPLSTEQAMEIIEEGMDGYEGVILHMDYVLGRCCKMVVFQRDGRLLIRKNWYDHHAEDMEALLHHIGLGGEEDA